jgi:hypothetical protein
VRGRLLGAIPLVAAALANLPAVYVLVANDDAPPVVALGFGFLAMGLAWAAGFRIEGRRRWFVLVMSAAGLLEGLAAATPPVDALLRGGGARWWLVASGALSALAGALVLRAGGEPAGSEREPGAAGQR